MEELDQCLETAYLLYDAVEHQLRGTHMNDQKSIRSSIALMLYLIAKLDTVQSSQNSDNVQEMKDKAFGAIHKLLNDWISVIGQKFGGIYGKMLISGNPELELKVILVLYL